MIITHPEAGRNKPVRAIAIRATFRLFRTLYVRPSRFLKPGRSVVWPVLVCDSLPSSSLGVTTYQALLGGHGKQSLRVCVPKLELGNETLIIFFVMYRGLFYEIGHLCLII